MSVLLSVCLFVRLSQVGLSNYSIIGIIIVMYSDYRENIPNIFKYL